MNDAPKLDVDDRFPEIELQTTDGGAIRLPADLADSWGVLLIYRGHW